MAASIYPDYPPQLSDSQNQYLLSNIKEWSILHGLAVRPSEEVDPSGSTAVTAPVTLFPSLFPRSCFDEARAVQTAYNELYASIASHADWLRTIMEELAEVDGFIAKLWDIHLAVEKEGYVQDLSLGLFRSDYMVHVDPSTANPTPQIKQVEFNTIASSFGGLSSQVSFLHKHLLSISAYPTPLITLSSLPPSPSTASLSLGLATAHKAYGPSKSAPALPLCILFIVHPHEPNLFDQAHLSTTLQQTHQIPTFRLPFASILSQTHIPQISSRPLIYTPPHSPNTPHEATTLYFRAGYDPSSYPTPQSWHSRLHLERSAAIKCPSILTHLAGSKKIQQVLATPSSPNLSRFTSNPETAARIQNTFAAIYPLDSSPAGEKAKAIATDEGRSAGYVLKPQREGGGNNIYRRKIPAFLRSLGDESRWRGHILMELIEPPALQNSLMRNGEVRSGEVIGELGIYGVCLWRSGRKPALEESSTQQQQQRRPEGGMAVVANWEAGYLLRTKGRESEEGGVAAGFGAVDSACLV